MVRMIYNLYIHGRDGISQGSKSITTYLNEQGINRLYEGDEKGVLELNDSLESRIKNLNVKKKETLIQLAGLRQRQTLQIGKTSKNEIQAFCKALKTRFNDPNSGFGKAYIKLLVDEIRIGD
jgi:site-specific DNA recombinase